MVSSSPAAKEDVSAGAAYAEIALPVPLRKTFAYKIPSRHRGSLQCGARVSVPFGKRHLTGYVVSLTDSVPEELKNAPGRLKKIEEVLDDEPMISDEILRLTRWAADYYACSWGELLKAALPAGLQRTVSAFAEITDAGTRSLDEGSVERSPDLEMLRRLAEGAVQIKDLKDEFGSRKAAQALLRLIDQGLAARTSRTTDPGIAPKSLLFAKFIGGGEPANRSQARVLAALAEADENELPVAVLRKRAGVSDSPIRTLSDAGIIQVVEKAVARDPLAERETQESREFVLTEAQENALRPVSEAISARSFKAFLLHGITGSGKTEVYIRAMKKALREGRTALMLVPEIALTPALSWRLRSVFGQDVAILHSSLSKGERFDEWTRLREGRARIAIGTRSAVFAPLSDLGLVVVDEEHDTSYRQQEMPYYHGRDLAVVRAKMSDAAVILGSATPALETFFNTRQGKYEYLELPERIGGRPLASAEIVDLRRPEPPSGDEAGDVISDELAAAIEENHSRGGQTILLLNRRGFSQFVLCRKCGETVKCVNCEITLTFHKSADRLLCHYCGYGIRTPVACPHCESPSLIFMGEGTEQLEKVLRKRFPALRIERVDRDTTRKRKQLERILDDFSKGELDMLVGTQMLAKGHDFPNVTLVGAVSVDSGLSLPDFRAAERTFQLLTQVAGRAGRGDLPGKVLIQTYHPDHYALLHAREQSYLSFYEHEVKFRERMHYPPFVSLASVLVKHGNLRHANETANKMRKALDEANGSGACIVLGPAPAALSKLKGEFRVQILIKSRTRRALRETLDDALAKAEKSGADMRIVFAEIDPVNLL